MNPNDILEALVYEAAVQSYDRVLHNPAAYYALVDLQTKLAFSNDPQVREYWRRRRWLREKERTASEVT